MSKHRDISETLTQAIRSGELAPGDKLPAERELAERFGVHRMTVRQATTTLVTNGLVVKRLPAGVFVRTDADVAAKRRLNIVCPAGDLAQASAFIAEGIVQSEADDRTARVLRLYPGDEHLAVEAMASSDPTLLIGLEMDRRGPLLREAKRARDRTVVIGSRMDDAGIASVVGDDEMGLRLAVEYLHGKGHERIALVCSLPGEHNPLMEVQVQQFRHAVHVVGSGDARPREVLRLDPEIFKRGTIPAAAAAVEAYCKRSRRPATAFIGLSEDATHGTASALHQLGLRVPQDVSLLGYAGTPLSAYAIPPHTIIDIGIKGHMQAALAWIKAHELKLDSDDLPPLRQRITPTIIERSSVAEVAETPRGHGGLGDSRAGANDNAASDIRRSATRHLAAR